MKIFKKNVKVIYLMGGLGNIFFQINFACNMRDAGYEVRLNVYALMNNNIISKLLGWSNHNTLENIIELGVLNNFEIDNELRFAVISSFISKKTKKSIFGSKFYGINSPSNGDIDNLKNIFGYFHNENPINDSFVKHLRQRLEHWLSLKPKLQESINMLIHHDDIVVHVRGGDFNVNSDLELSVDYYKKAIVSSKMNSRPVRVLTNDILHAESILRDFSFQIISQDSPVADFIILMKARIKVLANSTFSWWAAELGDDNCKIVEVDLYYPKLKWSPRSRKQRIRISRAIN